MAADDACAQYAAILGNNMTPGTAGTLTLQSEKRYLT